MYELAIGGYKGDSGATIYDDLLDLNISENPTALGSWDAQIPYTLTLEDELLADIVVYYDGEIIFEGILESVESSFDDSTTKLSGRGIPVRLEYQADTITYSSTTVYDALTDFWANHTDFDGYVQPPNRDLYEDVDVSEADFRQRFNDDEATTHRIYEYHVGAEGGRLFPRQLNVTEDMSMSSATTDGADTSDSAYSNEKAVRFDGSAGSYLDWTYAVPSDPDYSNDDYRWYVRLQSSSISDATLDFYIDGTHVETWSLSSTSLSHQWLDVLNDSRLSSVNSPPSSISSDPTFRIEMSGLASGEWLDIDAQSVTDETFGSYTLPGSTNADGVYTGPEWYPDGVTVDGESGDGYVDMQPSSATDRLGATIETVEAVSTFRAECKNKDTGEVVSDTHTRVGTSTVHQFDFQFADTGTDFALRLKFDGQLPDTQSASGETSPVNVSRIETYAPDTSKFVTISDAEFNGTLFDICKSLHERGAYRFAVTDYENEIIESFPQNTMAEEPFWQIKSESRKLDYTDYANTVTVHGKTASDGTYNSATVSDQDEIDVVGRKVHHYEKNPEVSTQAEVDSRARRLLEEKLGERDESGSMDVVPQLIDVGYTYPISTWSDVFRYGGRVGTNALEFRGTDGAPDYVEFSNSGEGPATDVYTFEALVYPRNLDELGDDEYVGVLSMADSDTGPTYNDLLVVYGDGSVSLGFGQPDHSDAYRRRSSPDIVNNRESQRISGIVRMDGDFDIYVDGQHKATLAQPSTTGLNQLAGSDMTFYVGLDADGSSAHPFDGGIDDVRIFYGERTQAQIDDYAYTDLMESTTANLERLVHYLRFDDRSDASTAIVDSGANYAPDDGTVTGATYESAFGRLEEIQYSLGTEGNLSLKFDISGRIDTELIALGESVQQNRRNL
jgi:hypothetical protein